MVFLRGTAHLLQTGIAGIDLIKSATLCKCLDCIYCSCCSVARLQHSSFPTEYFCFKFGSVVYFVVKQNLFASKRSQKFTVSLLLMWLFQLFFFFFPLTFFYFASFVSIFSPLNLSLSPLTSCSFLCFSSSSSGGSFTSDAACWGQPLVSVTGGNLQTTLCQKGHWARQPHLPILWPPCYCAGSRHTSQPPGMRPVINHIWYHTAWCCLFYLLRGKSLFL